MAARTAKTTTLMPVAFAAILSSSAFAAETIDMGDFELGYSGYIKLDTLVTDYSDGNPADGSIGRDFYVPSTTPVNGNGEDAVFDMHAKQTRFRFGTKGEYDGHVITGAIEMDFLLSVGGNERVSNSYNPRLRHAFVTYDNWLVGQTWSNFQNVGALPDTLDFIGPSEATIFNRQSQVRWKTGPWSFSLENPDTTVYLGDTATRISTDSGSVPDATARYEFKGDWGNVVIAGLLRELKFEESDIDIDENEVGYGLSVSGKQKIGARNDFRWMVSAGEGLGRYIGLNFAPGGQIDADGDMDTIGSVGVFGAYRHFWNDKFRSTFQAGYLTVDNDEDDSGGAANETAWNTSANLIFQPVKSFFFGGEVKYAKRETENGDDGEFVRFQFSARYNF